MSLIIPKVSRQKRQHLASIYNTHARLIIKTPSNDLSYDTEAILSHFNTANLFFVNAEGSHSVSMTCPEHFYKATGESLYQSVSKASRGALLDYQTVSRAEEYKGYPALFMVDCVSETVKQIDPSTAVRFAKLYRDRMKSFWDAPSKGMSSDYPSDHPSLTLTIQSTQPPMTRSRRTIFKSKSS